MACGRLGSVGMNLFSGYHRIEQLRLLITDWMMQILTTVDEIPLENDRLREMRTRVMLSKEFIDGCSRVNLFDFRFYSTKSTCVWYDTY